MPNHEGVEKLIKGYVEAIALGDLERVFAYYDDDIVYEDLAVNQIYRGLKATKAFYTASMTALDVRWHVNEILTTEEGYGLAWVMTGQHVKDLPGMPATNRTFEVPGASIGEVRDGKITRNRDFWNHHALLKQLGYKLVAPEAG